MSKKIEDTREGLDTLTKAELDEAIADGNEILVEMASAESPSAEDVAAAAAIDELVTAAEARRDALVAEETSRTDQLAEIRARAEARRTAAEEAAKEPEAEVTEPEQPETDVVAEPVVDDAPTVLEGQVVETVAPAAIAASATTARAALAGRKAAPPKVVEPDAPKVLIKAAADAGVVASGSSIGLPQVMDIAHGRWDAMSGTSGKMSLGIASFETPFTNEFTVNSDMKDEAIMQIVDHAADEKRLPKALTAAGGWCAPSETIYDLCPGATTEGMFDLPEIRVNRGGIRYTEGPDYSPLFTADNILTEAEVLAGTDKTCIEVTCPDFDDVRLDAVYMCVTSPLLTRVGYPELEQGFLQQAMVAHQRRVSNSLRARVVAAAGTPLVAGAIGSIAGGALVAVELVAEQQRESRGWAMNETIEAVVPSWFRVALRADYSLRTGIHEQAISDADIASYFAVRGIRVQYLYGWQSLPADSVEFPPTVDILIYKAGTFVAGKAPVIKLNAVYDSAMLKENTHIALFFEEGILVLGRCNEAKVITVPVCVAGRTGIANLAECLVTGA